MPFRFVHTADIHLDSPLRSLALRAPELVELVGNATRLAFEQTIDLCLAERVDALVIAGDLYDGQQTSMKTALFLAAELQRLNEAGILVFIVRGNHDAMSRITRELTFPDNVKVFGGRGEAVELERPRGEIPIVFHGVSFARPRAPQSLVPKFRARVKDAFNIGLLHTSLAGSTQHDDYAPCSVDELAATGFDYWCLGHIHKHGMYRQRPRIIMPGMPQGRDISEDGPKSVTMVTIRNDASVELQLRHSSIAQFERLTVNLTGTTDWSLIVERIDSGLKQLRDSVKSEHLVVRLDLQGESALAWRLKRDLDVIKGEADSRAQIIGRTWVEKVELNVRSETTHSVGPVSDLATRMLGPIARSEELRQEANRLVEELESLVPAEVRFVLGDDQKSRNKILQSLISKGCEDVLAHLREGLTMEKRN